jgi:hypothetical protein
MELGFKLNLYLLRNFFGPKLNIGGEVSGQLHAPAALPRRKEPLVGLLNM